MITAAEERHIVEAAYVPEHLPGYVTAISQSESYLLGDYLCYRSEDSLVFFGYSLRPPGDEEALTAALRSAISRFRPRRTALVAPAIPAPWRACRMRERDQYYRLELSRVAVDAKLRNMLRRASRELKVEVSEELREEHRQLIAEFLVARQPGEETRFIFERIPAYVSAVFTARVFSARNGSGALVAFDVAEFGARDYAFYQFNFRSRKYHVPGASDLLLHAVITTAREHGKRFLNLGLGINEGVRGFKEKWGAMPFLGYECCRFTASPPTVLDVLMQRP